MNLGSIEYPLHIKTGGKDIIASGTSHAIGDSLSMKLSSLNFEFRFKDEKEETQKVRYKIEDDIFIIELINLNNPIGNGIKEPIEVGFLNNRKLYLSFVISRIEGKSTSTGIGRLEYTFYLGEDK